MGRRGIWGAEAYRARLRIPVFHHPTIPSRHHSTAPLLSTLRMIPDMTKHAPDFHTFARLAKQSHLVPVYRRLLSDSLTPVSAFHKIDGGRCACLFESV